MNAVELIKVKRDGGTLTDDQVRWFIDAYTSGEVADEQASSLLMAVFFRGMAPSELATWTAAMIASGERLDLSSVSRPTVDKHSTGGVGDKISLPLVPLVAACGAAVPQLAGRGLGHTGGTLDKMESFPGWRALLSNAELVAQLQTVGGVIAGSGAFMVEVDRARQLAETMVSLGEAAGVRTVALLTDMSVPLGVAVGNAVEVRESVEVLSGGGPADVIELTVALAEVMLEL